MDKDTAMPFLYTQDVEADLPDSEGVLLAEVIDVPALQELLDYHYALTGFAVGILDLAGEVLIKTGWQDICVNFHRAVTESCTSCHESDLLLSRGVAPGEFKAHRCKNGLWDMVSPIMLGRRHIGNIFIGQFFYDDEILDLELFRAQAGRFGYDETAYLTALDKVPRFSRQTIQTAMNFYAKLAEMISSASYSRMILMHSLTMRKQDEAKLRVSELEYRTLADSGQALIWRAGTDKLCYYFNTVWLDFTGRTFEQEFGNGWVEGVHGDDLQRCFDTYVTAFDRRERFRMDYRLRRHDGEFRWIQADGCPRYDLDGHFCGYIGYCLDITDRKQAELEREILSQRLQVATSAAHLGVWEWNVRDHTMVWSERMFELYGIGSESFPNTVDAWVNGLHPADRALVMAECQAALKGEKPFNTEFRVLQPDGTIKYIRANGLVLPGLDGTPERMIGINADISENRRVQKSLLDSEERLSLTLEAANAGNWDWDIVNDRLHWSAELFNLFGLSSGGEAASFELWERIVHPDDLETASSTISAAVRNRVQLNNEYRVILPDGSSRWIAATGRCLYGRDGEPVRMIGICTDISAAKKTEHALQESEYFFKESQRVGAIGSYKIVFAAACWDSSDVLDAIFGIDRSYERSVQGWLELVHPDDREEMGRYLMCEVVAGGKPFSREYRIVRRSDGEIRWVNGQGELGVDGGGKVVSMIGTIQDITERKLIQETLLFLLQSSSRSPEKDFFELLAHYLADSLGFDYVCIDRLQGDALSARTLAVYHDGKIDENCEYTLKDTPCGEVVGKDICVFPANVCQLFPEDAALQELQAESYLGTTLWSFDMKPIGLIALIGRRPLTDHALAEAVLKLVSIRAASELDRLLAEQELKAKNAELERFSYTVSHDLKSPLITIQAYAGMIMNDLGGGLFDRAAADLKKIEGAALKMTALLNDLLELSRIGRVMHPPVAIDMNHLLEDVLAQLEGTLLQQQAEIVISRDLPRVSGDRKRIAEVLQNLLENALKYMGEQAAPRIEVGCRQENREAVFSVLDNGQGIEPQYHENIFGLFNKLDPRSEGTGVGLALVKRIIEFHGGRVWVESAGIGTGSTFCFTLKLV